MRSAKPHREQRREQRHDRQPLHDAAAAASESSSNRLLRWLKKSIGIKSSVKKRSSGHRTPQRRQRSLSFVFEKRSDSTSGTLHRSHGVKDKPKHHTTGSGNSHVRTLQCPPPTFPRSIHDFPQHTPARRQLKTDRPPHVLIAGAGIGGLCLAQGLKKLGIPFTVFERDPSPHYTTQGYRVQINTGGYEALKATLSTEKFDLFLSSTGAIFPTTTTRDAHTGRVLCMSHTVSDTSTGEPGKQVFSVNRSMLRALLLSDLEEGVEIKYGMAFKRFHVLPNGIVEVHFDNGCFTQGTMLVGADGTASRVRQQFLSRHIKVFDTDCGIIYGKTPLTAELKAVGLASDTRTVITSQNPKMAIIIEPQCTSPVDLAAFASPLQQQDYQQDLPDLHKYVCWVLLARLDKFRVDGRLSEVEDLYSMASDEVADVAMELTTQWDPRMRLIVDLQAREWASFMRISTMAPNMRAWTPSVVTLIGDAAHTMPPGGFGCNSALQDANQLCELFQNVGVSVEAVAQFEKQMRARVKDEIHTSIQVGHELYDLPPFKSMEVIASWL